VIAPRGAESGLRAACPPVRGFALLAVLWVLTALSAAVGGTLAALRVADGAEANRLVLTRGRWAAEACLAVAAARWGTSRWTDSAEVDLGRSTRCAWHSDDPASRLNVNLASPETLLRFLARAGVAEDAAREDVVRLLALRRREALTDVRAAASVMPAPLLRYLTTEGEGVVNATDAFAPVLGALPGMTEETVELLIRRRARGRPVPSLDALVGQVSPSARALLLSSYADLARTLAFAPPQLVLTAEGWVAARGRDPRAVIELVVVPLRDRLAVVRRRMR
jgi:hypothetical protein